MASDIGCIYCSDRELKLQRHPSRRTDTTDLIFLIDGCSVCQTCLRKIQTGHESMHESIAVNTLRSAAQDLKGSDPSVQIFMQWLLDRADDIEQEKEIENND